MRYRIFSACLPRAAGLGKGLGVMRYEEGPGKAKLRAGGSGEKDAPQGAKYAILAAWLPQACDDRTEVDDCRPGGQTALSEALRPSSTLGPGRLPATSGPARRDQPGAGAVTHLAAGV